MKTLIVPESFVQPTLKAPLKDLGLTATEIAASLGANKFDVVRSIKKFEKLGMITVFKQSCLNGDNIKKTTEYYLNIQDAKFIVATYQNMVGWQYTKYLIEVETKYIEQRIELVKLNNLLHQQLTALRDFEDMIRHGKTFTPRQQNYYNHLRLKLEKDNPKP